MDCRDPITHKRVVRDDREEINADGRRGSSGKLGKRDLLIVKNRMNGEKGGGRRVKRYW